MMSDFQRNYYKKEIYLPYGQKLIQIFEIENEIIKKAICYNEYLKRSFIIEGLANFPLVISEEIVQTTKEEFNRFEAYI